LHLSNCDNPEKRKDGEHNKHCPDEQKNDVLATLTQIAPRESPMKFHRDSRIPSVEDHEKQPNAESNQGGIRLTHGLLRHRPRGTAARPQRVF
jgi:hypothetical protein